MPDTIRDGWLAEYMGERRPWVAYKSDVPESPHDEPCVVVTGRTAQETREAFELLDNRNRIFPGCVRDA
jgi:hypothetical protein